MHTSTYSPTSQRSESNYYPWLIWSLGAAFVFYNYLLQVAPSIISQQLMAYYHVNATAIGHLGASYFYTYLIMQIPVGLLLDRFGLRVPTTLAILVATFGAILFALAPNFTVACLARAIIGLGGAFSAVSCLKLCAMWFRSERFPLLAGLMMTVAMLGATSGGGPLAYMVTHVGWRMALLSTASFGLILAMIYWLLVRDGTQLLMAAMCLVYTATIKP